MMPRRLWRRAAPLIAVGVAFALAVTACSGGGSKSTAGASAAPAAVTGTLRLGYFPNLTHAPAIYGVSSGIFAKDLGGGVTIKPSTFNSGTQEQEAFLSGALDAGFIGPNPAVNIFTKSDGSLIRIVSGVTSGGAKLVVKASITSVDQLKGKIIATPGLANTQDVALRWFLKEHGYTTTTTGGGDVQVKPEDNSVTQTAFATGAIDGAWVPEPTASQLVSKGGHVLADEASQWPNGQFTTTVLIVRTDYLKKNPEIVRRLIQATLDSEAALAAAPGKGADLANTALGQLTGKPLSAGVLAKAWPSLTFGPDPVASALTTSADHAAQLGLIKKPDLAGIFDLNTLNQILTSEGRATISES
jgi:NitT/TauT family transport system substrate-binding protein